MRKTLNILMCLCLILQNFIFALPVFADGNVEIELVSLEQDGKPLEQQDGVYQVNGYGKIILKYRFNNLDANKKYYFYTTQSSESFYGEKKKGETFQEQLFLCDDDICEYKLGISDTYDEYGEHGMGKYLSELNIKIHSTTTQGSIEVTGVQQGGKELILKEIDEYNKYYSINDLEDLTISLKGTDLNATSFYTINLAGLDDLYCKPSGEELMQGTSCTFPIGTSRYGYSEEEYIDISVESDIYNYIPVLQDYSIIVNKGTSSKDFTMELTYTNFPNQKINYDDFLFVNKVLTAYHDKDNSLTMAIDTDGYEDKDYEVELIAERNGNSLIDDDFEKVSSQYQKKVNINGLELNDGYKLILDDLILKLNTDNDEGSYTFKLKVGDITKCLYDFVYTQEKDAALYDDLFFENGNRFLTNETGDEGWYNHKGNGFEVNKNVFSSTKPYLYFYGVGFQDNVEYDYKLEYGVSDKKSKYSVIDSGTIKGKTLNTEGLIFQIDNQKKYSRPVYGLTVKRGEEIVFELTSAIPLQDNPTFGTVELSANNKNIYLVVGSGLAHDFSYMATRNFPPKINIYGIGYDDKEQYDVELCSALNNDSPWDEDADKKCNTYTFSGKKLNSGTASINWNEKYDKSVEKVTYSIKCYKSGNRDEVIDADGFVIDFVESKDFFPKDNPYKIDNVKDIIKNIGKKTKTSDFENNVDITNNGHIKIYDKTGTIEQKDYVGTGMIARISDENNRSLLDMDIVVKGDTTGDGNISITDLVQVKQHLANTKKLSGVYEVAANVTDTGNVGITDLVKVSRDVAGIEVLK